MTAAELESLTLTLYRPAATLARLTLSGWLLEAALRPSSVSELS